MTLRSGLLLGVPLLVAPLGSRLAAQGETAPAYHLEAAPAHHLRATLTFNAATPNMAAREWVLFAPAPPAGVGQTAVRWVDAAINGSPVRPEIQGAGAPGGRQVLRLRQPAGAQPQECTAVLTYETTLLSSKLVPGAPERPVPPLPAQEARLFLQATRFLDYSSPAVVNWLRDNDLSRRPGETEIDLAKRVLTAMQAKLSYAVPAEWMDSAQASRVCRNGKSECGGLSVLFATALRANRVPARVLYGIFTNGDTHSIAEFYAAGIGWVPVEVASAVSFKQRTVPSCIGTTDGTYLTLHVDPNLEVETVNLGRQVQPWLNVVGMVNWSYGEGTYTGQVTQRSWKFEVAPVEKAR